MSTYYVSDTWLGTIAIKMDKTQSYLRPKGVLLNMHIKKDSHTLSCNLLMSHTPLEESIGHAHLHNILYPNLRSTGE